MRLDPSIQTVCLDPVCVGLCHMSLSVLYDVRVKVSKRLRWRCLLPVFTWPACCAHALWTHIQNIIIMYNMFRHRLANPLKITMFFLETFEMLGCNRGWNMHNTFWHRIANLLKSMLSLETLKMSGCNMHNTFWHRLANLLKITIWIDNLKLCSIDWLSTSVARCKCPYQKDYVHSYLSTGASTGR